MRRNRTQPPCSVTVKSRGAPRVKRWVRAYCRGKVSDTLKKVALVTLNSVLIPDPHSFEELSDSKKALWAKYGSGKDPLFVQLVGVAVEEVRVDYCRLSLPFRSDLLQAGGAIHGGVLSTLLDTSCVPAVGSGFDEARPYSTISMHVQFLSSASDSDLTAVGWVTRRGKSIAFCNAAVHTADGKPLATAALTFKI
ncbi:MAG: hypothetical protein CL460_03690 [Acidimicrobiaceae bacterium]|nr:hypothetical protein [Acidimicrobiaceae bacterium]